MLDLASKLPVSRHRFAQRSGRIPDYKLPCRCPRRRTAFDNLDHSNSQIIRIPHRQPPQPEKATESYSRLIENPFDSQKVETALEEACARGSLR